MHGDDQSGGTTTAGPRNAKSRAPGGPTAVASAGSMIGSAADAAVEAVLLSVDKPVPAAKVAEVLALVPGVLGGGSESGPAWSSATVNEAVARLNAGYDATGRSFRIESVAGGLRLMTRPEFAPVLAAFHRARAGTRLSRPAIESLAIIAYRQPITRGDLEAIRGVACGEVLRSLLERRLIAVVGRAEVVGRPMLYGTTRQFLELFGLASLRDLPQSGPAGSFGQSGPRGPLEAIEGPDAAPAGASWGAQLAASLAARDNGSAGDGSAGDGSEAGDKSEAGNESERGGGGEAYGAIEAARGAARGAAGPGVNAVEHGGGTHEEDGDDGEGQR